ncbi:MAG: metalloregulator ArsR/SmtB family transcription factor [Actinobacteria bacterium]|nr:metalloregulator ArsR/SmtB family transcription factor [Chloroflexota bacterium]MBE3128251.1 metalloregulator ArsR/SmtB family transcription factor [Actinomycetota bacterium]
MQQYVDLFKALADETRLRIIVLLSEKELCVCQIEAALVLSQVKVSRHLTILRYAGLVNCRREGTWVYYSLTEPKNKIEESLFESFKKHLRKEKFFSVDISNMEECISQPLNIISERSKKL